MRYEIDQTSQGYNRSGVQFRPFVLDMTLMMVTHDFSEARYLGEKVAIIHNGTIEQSGTVSDFFQHPATPFVAQFVGFHKK